MCTCKWYSVLHIALCCHFIESGCEECECCICVGLQEAWRKLSDALNCLHINL